MREQPHALGTGPGISRRALIGALGLLGWPAAAAGGTGLASVAASAGIRFGSAMRAASLDDPPIAALLARECASLTPELEMKWAALSPTRDAFDTAGADAIAAFAARHAQRLRGHALLWHRSMPDWFAADPQWPLVSRHIAQTAGRWRTAIDEWDVVNEPVDAGGLRQGVMFGAFGPTYVARALDEAHAAAPAARLMLNDYDLEYDLPDQAARRAALLTLARTLVGDRAPLGGIGVQMHLAVGRPFLPAALRDFLVAIGDLGLSVSITEFDVRERDLPLPPAQRDAIVADHAARVLDVALATPVIRSLTCWGLSDRQSWLEVTTQDRERFPGAWRDGSTPGLNRGLPFDSDCRPKPLRNALGAALTDAKRARSLRRLAYVNDYPQMGVGHAQTAEPPTDRAGRAGAADGRGNRGAG